MGFIENVKIEGFRVLSLSSDQLKGEYFYHSVPFTKLGSIFMGGFFAERLFKINWWIDFLEKFI